MQMETLKYTTQIEGKTLSIPEHILERLDKGSEVEVVFRPVRYLSNSYKDLDKVIDEIKRKMDSIWEDCDFNDYNFKLTFDNKKCEICGFKETVDKHHVDKNRKNNIRGNIVVLCPNHHAMIHRLKMSLEVLKKLPPKKLIEPKGKNSK